METNTREKIMILKDRIEKFEEFYNRDYNPVKEIETKKHISKIENLWIEITTDLSNNIKKYKENKKNKKNI